MTAPVDERKLKLREANICVGTGIGVGLLGAGGALLGGAVCPVCVVAAPLLLGAGLIGRILAVKNNPPNSTVSEPKK